MTPEADPLDALASEVNRLFVAVHRVIGSARTEVRGRLEALGIASPVFLIDLRALLFEGVARKRHVDEFARFVNPAMYADVRNNWWASGSLTLDDDRLVPSDQLMEFCVWLTDQQRAGIGALWAEHDRAVAELMEPAAAAIVGNPAADVPLFAALRDLPKSNSEAFELHHRITVLRYLRADLHVAALRGSGIRLPEASLFDAIAQSQTPEPWLANSVDGLVATDWATFGSGPLPVPTEAGLYARAAIDALVRDQMESLIPKTVVEILVARLGELPG